MRVSVIGAGAIGGWLTAGCINAGAEATVLARGASLEALRKDGLGFDDGMSVKRYPVQATDDPSTLRGADVLLLGLKAHDLPGAAPLIEAALGPDTIVVPAINGLPWWFFDRFGGPMQGQRIDAVDPGGILSNLIPAARVVGTVVHAASYVPTPGTIRAVKMDQIYVGDAGTGHHAEAVAKLFNAGGIPTTVSDRLHWVVWNKLWGNSNMNPLSALARADLSQLLGEPNVHDLIVNMMREMTELGSLIGLEGFEDPLVRTAVTRKLGKIRTSMLQDVEAGRPVELEPILGTLVELGRRLDHPTPFMNGVYGLTKLLDANLRGVEPRG